MLFEEKFFKAEVVKRYKRFIVDAKLWNNDIVSAFCSDITVIPDLYVPKAQLMLSRTRDKSRKLKYEVEAVNKGDGWVMVNQKYFPQIFMEAFQNKSMKDFAQYSKIRKLKPADRLPHLDFELSNGKEKCFVCLSPIYNKQNGKAVFPTKVNLIDMEMFEEMKKVRQSGHRTVVVLVVPRMDCLQTLFSWTLDPISAAKIYDEAKNGLEFVSYGCNLDKNGINITNKMDICIK